MKTGYPAVGDRVLVHGVAYHTDPLAGLVTGTRGDFICIRVFHPETPSLDQTLTLRSSQRDYDLGVVYWTYVEND